MSVIILDTKGKITVDRLDSFIRAGYEIRIGSNWQRVEPEGEYQLFAPSGVFVRKLASKPVMAYLRDNETALSRAKGLHR